MPRIFKETNTMKTKMKKLVSIKSMLVLAVALAVASGLALAVGHDPVSGSGSADLDLLTGTAVGQAELTIGDSTLFAEVFVQLTSQVPGDDGSLHATATHRFKFDNGSITTTDKGVIDTDGTLNEHLTIVSGTGDFEGTTGELAVHGQVQFPALGEPPIAHVSYDIRGVISR
jgi:hypothetical protein